MDNSEILFTQQQIDTLNRTRKRMETAVEDLTKTHNFLTETIGKLRVELDDLDKKRTETHNGIEKEKLDWAIQKDQEQRELDDKRTQVDDILRRESSIKIDERELERKATGLRQRETDLADKEKKLKQTETDLIAVGKRLFDKDIGIDQKQALADATMKKWQEQTIEFIKNLWPMKS